MDIFFSWFNDFLTVIKTFEIIDLIDIIVITFVIYSLFKLVRETRAEQLIKGIVILLVAYLISVLLDFTMIITLLETFFQYSIIIIVIVFQPEIRKALERIGQSKLSRKRFKFIQQESHTEAWIADESKAITDVCNACNIFQRIKTGAIIVFERQTKLLDIAQTGTIINAKTSVQLIGNIFFNKAPLHDGAMIVRDGLVYAAGCILPLTTNENVDASLGTRHRSALGMSEQSDAIIVIVSEETGIISIADNGKLTRDYTKATLEEKLRQILIPDEDEILDLTHIFSSKRKEKKNNGKD